MEYSRTVVIRAASVCKNAVCEVTAGVHEELVSEAHGRERHCRRAPGAGAASVRGVVYSTSPRPAAAPWPAQEKFSLVERVYEPRQERGSRRRNGASKSTRRRLEGVCLSFPQGAQRSQPRLTPYVWHRLTPYLGHRDIVHDGGLRHLRPSVLLQLPPPLESPLPPPSRTRALAPAFALSARDLVT